jgi:hypothetical protein
MMSLFVGFFGFNFSIVLLNSESGCPFPSPCWRSFSDYFFE